MEVWVFYQVFGLAEDNGVQNDFIFHLFFIMMLMIFYFLDKFFLNNLLNV